MIISFQQFDAAYRKLPSPLREYLASEELAEIVTDLGSKYGLHIDTTGAVKRETTNMLLGFINPEQFVGELKSVGVPEASIGAIVEELNTKVFIPLREKMKNAPPEEPEEADTSDSENSAQPYQTPPVSSVQYSAPAPTPPVPAAPAATPVVSYVPTQPEPIRAPIVAAPSYIPPTQPIPAAPPAQIVAPSVSQFTAPIAPIYVPPAPIPEPLILPGQIIPAIAQVTQPEPAPVFVPSPAPVFVAPPVMPIPLPQAPVFVAPPVQHAPAPVFTVPVAAPVPASIPVPPEIHLAPTPIYVPPAVPVPPAHVAAAHARTMQEDMQNMASHQGDTPKHSLFGSHHDAPAPAPYSAPAAQPIAPVAQPVAPLTPAPQSNREVLHDILKGYGVDPYREPPE